MSFAFQLLILGRLTNSTFGEKKLSRNPPQNFRGNLNKSIENHGFDKKNIAIKTGFFSLIFARLNTFLLNSTLFC